MKFSEATADVRHRQEHRRSVISLIIKRERLLEDARAQLLVAAVKQRLTAKDRCANSSVQLGLAAVLRGAASSSATS